MSGSFPQENDILRDSDDDIGPPPSLPRGGIALRGVATAASDIHDTPQQAKQPPPSGHVVEGQDSGTKEV